MGNYYTGMLFNEKRSLKHFGILGMHWGQRRFQYADGSLTPEGRERYGRSNGDESKGPSKAIERSGFVKRYQNEDGKLTGEGKRKLSQLYGENSFPDETYFESKFGRIKNDMDEEWWNDLSVLSYGGYGIDRSDEVSDQKRADLIRQFKNTNDKLQPVMDRYYSIVSKIDREEADKIGLNKPFISEARLEEKRKLLRQRTNERIRNDSDAQAANLESEKLVSQLFKIENKYKDLTINQIINKLPNNIQEEAYFYFRMYRWDDQLFD